MISISKQINLSSNTATTSNYPKNSSCYFELPNMMKKHENVKYITLGISHAEIPVSFYIINDNNNKLVINLNNTGDYEFILTNGNYNANSFKTMLLSVLGLGWNISLSQSTGKYTLTYDVVFHEFIINGYLSTCNIIMGFNKNQYHYSSSLSLTLPFPCNFLGTSKINIKSSTLQLDNLDSVNKGHSSTITSISNSAELYGIILYTNQNNFKNIIYNDFLNGIDINITDENGIALDFNGVDWFISIEITSYLNSNEISNETNLFKFMKSQQNN